MANKRIVSDQTRNNLIIDSFMFLSGITTALSGIYFLFLPVAGYQGGRNPMYGVTILFERHTWGDIHIWASVIVIAFGALHIPHHWDWIVSMTKRTIKILRGQCTGMTTYGKFNLGVDVMIGLSALVSGLSGMYFLLVPGASHASIIPDPVWLFTRAGWDLIHTWSGVALVAAAALHFYIHWKWAYKITRKYWRAFVQSLPGRASKQSAIVQ